MNIITAILIDPIIGLELLAILLCAFYIVQISFQQENRDFDFSLLKTGLRQVYSKSSGFSFTKFFSAKFFSAKFLPGSSLLSHSTR